MNYPVAKTKVIATLGPATDGIERELIEAGASTLRINCSHGQIDQWQKRVKSARKAADQVGRPVAILIDLCGPKIRLAQTVANKQIKKGERVKFSGDKVRGAIEVSWPRLIDAVQPGLSEIVIGDGAPRFHVEKIIDDTVVTRAISSGKIEPSKGVMVTHASQAAPALTRKDLDDLEFAASIDADFVALSFVRNASDVELLQMALRLRDCRARTIAKIEKVEAVENIAEISRVADGIMVARGDLGVEVGVARVPLLQKEVLDVGRAAGKLTVVATQMLESMIASAEPTRAEANDIANAVLDGASAVMLSAETAVGHDPVGSVQAMVDIAAVAESGPMRAWEVGGEDVEAAAVMQSAVLLARNLNAEAIITVTGSGGAARAAAKYRPRRPLIALTEDRRVARQLALEWGVMPAAISRPKQIEEFHRLALDQAGQIANLGEGRVIMTHGPAGTGAGSTNAIMIEHLDRDQ